MPQVERLIGHMRGKNDGDPFFGELFNHFHHSELISVVQMVGRFVHYDQMRFLHNCPRDDRLPLLSAGECIESSIS